MRGFRMLAWIGAAVVAVGLPAAIRYDADLAGAVRDVAGRLRPVRGAVPARVPLAVRADVAARAADARARRDAAIAPSRLDARGRAWADIGLGNGTEPAALYLALARDLEGMGLSADGTRLLVDEGRLTDKDFGGEQGDAAGAALLFATGVRPDEPAVAHLMAHVLQDQRGDPAGLREFTDATLAASAWREGEANLVALLLLYGGLGMEADVLAGRVDPASFREGDLQSPQVAVGSPVVRRLLEFVYGDGYRAAAAALREGGWRSVQTSTASPGTTTALLHPASRRGPPPPVPAPDLPVPAPLVLADRDSIGACGVGILVAEGAGKENLGWIAADGWEADALFRWERPDAADGITLWITRWTSEEEAGEFRYALGRTLASRFPGGGAEGEGTERVVTAGGTTYRLAGRGRVVRLRVASDRLDEGLGAIFPEDSKTNTTE